MKRIIINESSYENVKDKLVNEISYGTVDNAERQSYNLFDEVFYSFDNFYSELSNALRNSGEPNPYLLKMKNYADEINKIVKRKKEQQDNFFKETSKVDVNKFYNSQDAEENDIDDMDLNYLQQNYSK